MTSYVVRPDDARRAAGAITRYQFSRPRFALVLLAAFVVVVGVQVAFASAEQAVVAAVIVLVVIAGLVIRARQRLTRALLRSGLRPGTTMRVTFTADRFAIDTAIGSAAYPYRQVVDVLPRPGFVLVRLDASRIVLALPAPLVDADAAMHLQTCADANRGR